MNYLKFSRNSNLAWRPKARTTGVTRLAGLLKAAGALLLMLSTSQLLRAATPAPPSDVRVDTPGFPDIATQPQSQTVSVGKAATFTVTASGSAPLSYQWTFNGINVGSNTNVYTRSNCQLTDNGGVVRVTVLNSQGSLGSSAATLVVNPSGNIYYVAPNGSSGNTGLSTSSPWSVSYALANAGVSNTIIFMPGNYSSFSLSDASRQTGLTLRSLVKYAAIITGSSGHGIYIDYVKNVCVDGFQVSYSTYDGVKTFSSGGVVRNCWLHHNTGNGILWQVVPNTTVEDCLIEYNGWNYTGPYSCHGIYISGTNGVIRNNVIRHNPTWGLQVYFSGLASSQYKIYNNLIYGNKHGATVWAYGAYTNFVFGNTICYNTNYGFVANYGTIMLTNNIVLGNAYGDFVQGGDASSTWYCDYNASTARLSFNGAHDVVLSSAGFVKPSSGLYWLGSSSAARGRALAGVCGPVDFFGNAQSGVTDIGAFQYNATLAGDTRVLDPSPANPDYWSPPLQ